MSDLVTKFESLIISKYPVSFTKEQSAQAAQWESVLKSGQIQPHLDQLNLVLRDNTFIVSTLYPTSTDVHVFEVALPLIKDLVASSKDVKSTYTTYRHILRWIDYMQNLLEVSSTDKLEINHDLDLPHEVIEKKKKAPAGGAADAAAKADEDVSKKAKKQDHPRGKPDEETLKKLREEAKAKKAAKKAANAKQQQEQQNKAAEKPKPSAIDFRVGFIQKAIKHPDADSLYVSTIDVGDEEGPRTVCSGLVKHFPLDAMQERYVVVVCNLKPVNMRGIKSTAMVLCGSNDDKVEFVEPPKDSKAGDKVFFEGFGDEAPMKQLNPKKKIWEHLQPHFTTNDGLEVIFKDEEEKDHPVRKLTNAKGESFKVASIANAQVR
ncbi:ADI_G0020950.mRNA.1.CDS.1 [Saccharomyces cerevisiae]|nr:Arc1p [Saccharomyces cerevisiae YJM969]AJR88885.1 Arc1p [Saccharomyces cerevisiae YJM975]AJR89357.1 Arc1p [Saccharomyces cerevisiae YJM978]AJR89857.1 Arc1p [Saccharomyces cerevisiae YJM981]AJR91341.1 Arc1p [Saccharomyces cerevisiae YJM990]AJR91841.1 Arc1p [Saccharomyces cerevisiae YJM996]CAI4509020.1 ADI_G0020950.mRNA.1.CDS.1 [Saccharomyces cerevisiae]